MTSVGKKRTLKSTLYIVLSCALCNNIMHAQDYSALTNLLIILSGEQCTVSNERYKSFLNLSSSRRNTSR